MRLFNTLTQRLDPLEPTGNRVTLYARGITPYDTTHQGHATTSGHCDPPPGHLRRGARDGQSKQSIPALKTTTLRMPKKPGAAGAERTREEVPRKLAHQRPANARRPEQS